MLAQLFPNSSIAKKLETADPAMFDSMVAVWSSAIANIPDERIHDGLQSLMQSGSVFEPSLPAFLALCRSKPAAHQYKPLPPPKPPTDRVASISHLEPDVQHQLKRIGMVPDGKETQHEYSMRCKDYFMAFSPKLGNALLDNIKLSNV